MLFSLFPRRKVHYVDLMKAMSHTPFYKELSFWEKTTTFIARSFIICLICGLTFVCFSLVGILKANLKISIMLNEDLKNRDVLISHDKEYIQQISEENARMIKMQCSSPTDAVEIAMIINQILDTANGEKFVFLEQVIPHAIRLQVQKGIPASGMIAQAIYESGYGQSDLAKKHYNYFGMKNLTGKGNFVNSSTTDSGVKKIQPFRTFGNPYEGFLGYYEFLTSEDKNGRYDLALQQKNGIEYVKHLLSAGYCPDSDYLEHITEIIKRHHLDLLERILYKNIQNNSILDKFGPQKRQN